jgi:hypothetical protein
MDYSIVVFLCYLTHAQIRFLDCSALNFSYPLLLSSPSSSLDGGISIVALEGGVGGVCMVAPEDGVWTVALGDGVWILALEAGVCVVGQEDGVCEGLEDDVSLVVYCFCMRLVLRV